MTIPRGIRIDVPRAKELQQFCATNQHQCKHKLIELGFKNIDMSPRKRVGRDSLIEYFTRKKLIHLFPVTKGEEPSFKKENIEALDEIDPACIPLVTLEKMLRVVDDPFYAGRLCNKEGRVTCNINPLGADTGRDTSSKPNIIGLGKKFRPLVIAGEGNGLAELDFEQQEPLIIAHLANDVKMMDAYREGDIYKGMAARLFGKDQSDIQFKKNRSLCKVLTLGILYGMGENLISLKTGKPTSEITCLLLEFDQAYPNILWWRKSQPVFLEQRGYVETAGGLRRYRGKSGPLNGWEKRWAVNTPVQGSAGDILKIALLISERRLADIGARVILPVYDAVLLESPMGVYEDAIAIVKDAMIKAFQHFFPGALPRVDINSKYPGYWNKQSSLDSFGKDSLDRFFEDPLMPI
ncbi:MAG: hypothetical protein HQL31_01310 [Planctomycetes bacterium]|nr:hypothetical protein [Planctomycetota bacterium]